METPICSKSNRNLWLTDLLSQCSGQFTRSGGNQQEFTTILFGPPKNGNNMWERSNNSHAGWWPPSYVCCFIEGSLEVELPTIWTDGKAEVGRVREEKPRREKIGEEKE